MPIEVEKKYRLTKKQRQAIERRMREMALMPSDLDYEENTIYRGGRLNLGGCALRLRRVNGRAILTFKRRLPSKSAIKYQQEEEVAVENGDAMATILDSLGFQPGLIYEKRRTRWKVDNAKVVIDELPFGLFMEIEAPAKKIKRVEKLLAADSLPAVMETYPTLTARFGKERKGVIEARFESEAGPSGRARQKPSRRRPNS